MPGPKKAQRTKGNVKPSSSSQAAQLLAASGQAPSGFIGFSNQPAFVPASETFDEAESALDGDFRLVLRKFSKRDTVTKIKALHEFTALCKSKEDECLKAVVPFWPRIYNKVAIDVDHKVRELSQKALSTLAARVGKVMAPHLKSIMGTWMVSMCDTYPTVASAANGAFVNTFPPAKQTEVARFCKVEITECLINNITKQTAQTLSDPQTTSEEDMEGKYQRVVSSSLQALRKLLFMLTPDITKEFMSTHLTSLLSSPNFWKHAKSSVPAVKSGVLSILSATCQLCPEASKTVISKIAPYIFSCLDSTDPNIVSYSWEAAMSMISSHEDCWQHVNWQKAVWPKIKHVLESGCSGQAAVVSPWLLPLLSKIPNRNFMQFFDSFRLGFHEDSVLNSPQDTSALMKSFLECMQYSIKSIYESGDNVAEIKSLLMDQALVVLQASLTEPKPALSKTDLYASLCPLLALVHTVSPDTEECFWSDLSLFTRSRLMAEYAMAHKDVKENTKGEILQRIKLLVQGMVFQQSTPTVKKERVKFSTDDIKPQQKKNYYELERQRLSNSAAAFVSDLFVASFKLASLQAKTAPVYLSLFKELSVIYIPQEAVKRLTTNSDPVAVSIVLDLGEEPGKNFFSEVEDDLTQAFRSKLNLSDTSRENDYQTFLCDYIVKLLTYAQLEETVRTLAGGKFTDSLVVTMFAFVSYLNKEDGARFLFTVLDLVKEPQLTCQFIEHLLGHVKSVSACKQLVEGNVLASKIEQLTMSVTSPDQGNGGEDISEAVWKMLTSVVSSLDEQDNHLFSQSCLDAVMSSCLHTLRQLQFCSPTQAADTIGSVLGLVQALFRKHKVSTHSQLGELTQALLLLLLQVQCSGDVLKMLKSSWLAGFRLIVEKKSHTEIELHTQESCATIREWVKSKVETHDSLTHAISVVNLLLKEVATSTVDDEMDDEEEESNKGEENEENVGQNFDLEILSSAVDSLLITSFEDLDCTKEVYEYLCMSESVPCLVSICPQATSGMSVPAYLAGASYHTAILTKYASCWSIRQDVSQEGERVCPWSDTQLCSIGETVYRLIMLQTALKVKPLTGKEFPDSMTSNLLAGLVKCFRTLTYDQCDRITKLVRERLKSNIFPVFELGMHQVLERVAELDTEDAGKVSSAISKSLEAMRTQFLYRCLPSSAEAGQVIEVLTKSGLNGDSVHEAFTLATAVIMSCESPNVGHLAVCMSGFLTLAQVSTNLSDETKESLFLFISDLVKQLKDTNVHLLSGSDAAAIPSKDHIHFNISLAQALRRLLLPYSEAYWEFTLCTLVEWIQFLSEVQVTPSSNIEIRAHLVSVSKLTYQVAHTNAKAPVVAEVQPDTAKQSVTEKAATEWKEFFSEGVFSPLLPMFVTLAFATPISEPLWSLVLGSMAAAVSQCPSWLILAHELPAHLTVTDTSSLPDSLKTLLNTLCPMLMSRHRCVELASYKLLCSVMSEIPKYETTQEEDGKQEEELRSPPEGLIQPVELADQFLESLKVVEVEDHIVMDAGTEERAQAMGYLLGWLLLLQLFKDSSSQLRAKYAQYFKTHNLVSHLLDRLFRLIPPLPSPTMLDFSTDLVVDADGSETELGTLALRLYRQCLEILPAMVRTWWVDQDRKTSNFVDRFTTQYLSSSLIWQQITSAQNTDDSDMEGITIRARPAAREVSATYEMSEVTINMSIVLPENYPLGKLEVSCDKRVGVSQAQWDRWLLQLNILLQHQNGTIVEGLRLWKGNIDKKFEGIDDCMICFSVIHGTTFQLPRLTCKTCRKKFHSSCLYKWFNTSQKSSCPLCRNLF